MHFAVVLLQISSLLHWRSSCFFSLLDIFCYVQKVIKCHFNHFRWTSAFVLHFWLLVQIMQLALFISRDDGNVKKYTGQTYHFAILYRIIRYIINKQLEMMIMDILKKTSGENNVINVIKWKIESLFIIQKDWCVWLLMYE